MSKSDVHDEGSDHGESRPASARPVGLTDAEMFPELSSAFDALYFCVTPGNQFRKYYREGTYDDCDSAWQMFWRKFLVPPGTCLGLWPCFRMFGISHREPYVPENASGLQS
jgi:hypothetical protein